MVGHVQVELAHTPSRRNDLIQISSEVQEKTKESLNSNTQESLKTPQPNGEHNKTKQETRNFIQLISDKTCKEKERRHGQHNLNEDP